MVKRRFWVLGSECETEGQMSALHLESPWAALKPKLAQAPAQHWAMAWLEVHSGPPSAAGLVTAQWEHRITGTPARAGFAGLSGEMSDPAGSCTLVRAGQAALVFQTPQRWIRVWREEQTYGALPKAVRDDPQGWLRQQSNFIILTLLRVSDTSYIKCTTLSCSSREKISKPQEIRQFYVLWWKKRSSNLQKIFLQKIKDTLVFPSLPLSHSVFPK